MAENLSCTGSAKQRSQDQDLRSEGFTLFQMFCRANPLSYVSFRNQKIPRRFLVRFVPELRAFAHRFHPSALESWREELIHHNRSIRRGIRMGLCPHGHACSLVCDSLDDYMRRMCNAELACALTSLCQFGHRIMSRISRRPGAACWSVSGAMVITRESWLELCADIADLARNVACPRPSARRASPSRRGNAGRRAFRQRGVRVTWARAATLPSSIAWL